MYCPGQMRLPNPNAATEGSRTSRFRLPSDLKKRSGLNSDASRPYTFSSWRMALQAVRRQLRNVKAEESNMTAEEEAQKQAGAVLNVTLRNVGCL